MATKLSTIEIRIQNTQNNIEKSLKTLERHKKMQEKRRQKCLVKGVDPAEIDFSNNKWIDSCRDNTDLYWAICDYEDSLDSIKSTHKKIDELQGKLEGYFEQKNKLEDEQSKIPVVPAVEEFLQNWKSEADAFYRRRVEAFREFVRERNEKVQEIRNMYQPEYMYQEEIEAAKVAAGVDYDSFQRNKMLYGVEVIDLSRYRDAGEFDQRLNKMLSDEVDRKRADLFIRCTNAVGVITDATGLYIGNNLSLNGFVVGEQGKAKVETIRAGGYNVQCLHYRVLVQPVKEKEKTLLSEQIGNAEKEKTRRSVSNKEKVNELDR